MTEHTKVSDNEVIYAIRTVHQNQTQMNLMADQKANILVGLILVVMTMMISQTLPLSENPKQHLLLAAGLFALFALMSFVSALMVLFPHTTEQNKSQDIKTIQNPFFFGFFTDFNEDAYFKHMENELQISGKAREYLLRDIYQIGLVLQHKYKLLRRAYILAALSVASPLCVISGYIFYSSL